MPSARFILIWCYDPVFEKPRFYYWVRLYGEKFVADKNNTNSNKDMGEWASESLIVSKVRNTRKKGEREKRMCAWDGYNELTDYSGYCQTKTWFLALRNK